MILFQNFENFNVGTNCPKLGTHEQTNELTKKTKKKSVTWTDEMTIRGGNKRVWDDQYTDMSEKMNKETKGSGKNKKLQEDTEIWRW